jgi:hypothetical protein
MVQAVEPDPVFEAAGLQQALDAHGAVVTEEYLVHRLMQRVDLVLEHKQGSNSSGCGSTDPIHGASPA